jgi:hypothetical protein
MKYQLQNRPIRLAHFLGVVLVLGFSTLACAQYTECNRWQSSARAGEVTGRELERERWVKFEYCAIKHETIEAIRNGRMSLQNAISTCLELDEHCPRILANLRSSFDGKSDAEKEARWVAYFACDPSLSPDSYAALAARLDEEFQALFPTAARLALRGLDR